MRESTSDDDVWGKLDWNDVRIFLAVAESGSLSGATGILGMTQPTISRRMDDLEIRLGARLLWRSSRGVELTQAGETMRRLAAGMAKFGESIVRDLKGKDRDDAGQVTLIAPDGTTTYFLMPALADFQRANPQIGLTVDCGGEPMGMMIGEPDLVLEFAEDAEPDHTSIPIAHVHYAFYASRDYLNTYGAPKSFADVANHRMVRLATFKDQQATWTTKAKAVRELAGHQLLTNSSATMVEAIRCGVGIGSLPTSISSLLPELQMLDFEPVAHPTLFLRHHPLAVERGRVHLVKEWLLRVFDPVSKPWFRKEFIHPREFDRQTPAEPPENQKPYAANRRTA
jgi:DNA-binding transcriptional LysR family regulator